MFRALPRIAIVFFDLRRTTQLLAAGLWISAAQSASPVTPPSKPLADLSLEELTGLEISTVGKKPQRANEVAAAVFIITQDDIRRSGATSIPHVLRLVPGLQVAQIDGNKWAISARGFNSRFSNRLLVLMDGRTLYTLTFGGVFWDAQDTLIKDIERIEVVRGPGGALWGANAFNGVINIVTKHSAQTGGIVTSAEVGQNDARRLNVRIGDAQQPLTWRAFIKGFERGGQRDANGNDSDDFWKQLRIGGRADLDLGEYDAISMSAEAHRGSSGTQLLSYPSVFDAPVAFNTEDDYQGAFVTAEWSRSSLDGSRLSLRGFIDYTDRDSRVFDESRRTYDLEWQHTLARRGAHSWMWGVGMRHTRDRIDNTFIRIAPNSESIDFYNGFIQDEIAFLNDNAALTLGGKVEHSAYIGTQFMPNARLRYNVTPNAVVWSAVSRGVRSASRIERHVRVDNIIPSLPAGSPPFYFPAPIGIEIWGDPDFKPEQQTAYELGWRQRFSSIVSFDAAAYYNKYRDVRGVHFLPTVCTPGMTPIDSDPLCVFGAEKIVVPMQFTNLMAGNTWGGEIAFNIDPLPQWRVAASYSLFRYDFPANIVPIAGESVDFTQGAFGLDAKHQWNLRSSLSLGPVWDWDVRVRHVGALPTAGIEAYTEMDMRLAWRPRRKLELSLAGENLLDKQHAEFVSDFLDVAPTLIRRGVYLRGRWSY